MWNVEYTDEFEDWWNTLTEEEWMALFTFLGKTSPIKIRRICRCCRSSVFEGI